VISFLVLKSTTELVREAPRVPSPGSTLRQRAAAGGRRRDSSKELNVICIRVLYSFQVFAMVLPMYLITDRSA
jgi:hypothetical protein